MIPDPLVSDRQHARFYHRDLDGLTGQEVWAERTLVTLALATRIHERHRPRLIWVYGTESLTDIEWLRERLARLRDRQRRAAA